MSVQVQLRRDTYTNVAANHGAAGEVFVDTTNQRLVVQDGATNGGFPAPITLFVGNGGSTNNSNAGSGAYINHTPTFTIPANFMIAARAFRVTAHFQLTTGSTAPILTARLLLGSTVISSVGNTLIGPLANLTNVQFALQWIFQATQAPGASSNVQCAPIEYTNIAPAASTVSATAMPVAVATNAANAVTIATEWATAGAGTNTIGLNQLIVEALN
jgi:Major tropism determinant N-terminal domain